jgi:ATP-dependent DNA helicase RecQ
MEERLLSAAKEYLGVDYLFPYQRLVVQATVETFEAGTGEELSRQIVLLPTGAGKSLCFFLPAALLPGLTVVVYPLKALIRDQERRLAAGTLRARALSGDLDAPQRRRLFEEIGRGEVDMLLTNPEMLAQQAVRGALAEQPVTHLVIDEAHCVVEWGRSFRPAYLELSDAIDALSPRIVSAFTATASPEILSGIRRILFANQEAYLVRGNPDRPNIHYSVFPVLSKGRALSLLLQQEDRLPAVVFCGTRLETEMTCRGIRDRLGADRARFYHAGLGAEERLETESWFSNAARGVLVATCAWGMGVDRAGLRTVIHRDLPQTPERYLQEAGRAGRDGAPAAAILLATPSEIRRGPGGHPGGIGGYAGSTSCRRRYLLSLLGAETQECSGCDVCDGTRRGTSPLQEALESAIARAPRRFSIQELEDILAGRLPRVTALYGLMARWSPEEREEALSTFLASNRVRRIRKGPWRGRLVAQAASRQAPGRAHRPRGGR